MIDNRSGSAPPGEQEVCLVCGFCCDGTLFRHASLNKGEKGNLPEWIEKSLFSANDKDFFSLPCHYFKKNCSIYRSERADVCSAYRCQLLKDLAAGRVTMEMALKIVSEAVIIREGIFEDYRRITGNMEETFFLKLHSDLVALSGRCSEGDDDVDMLIARCNILEALLIRHIRSESDFEALIMNPGNA